MFYCVCPKLNDGSDYFQGLDKCFDTEEQAQAYVQTFEDWEQDLLEIDLFPF